MSSSYTVLTNITAVTAKTGNF